MRKKNFFSTILSLLILIALIACGYIFFKDMDGPSIAIVPDTGRVSPHTPLQITLADPSNIRSISVGVRRNNVVTPIFQRHFEEYLPQRTVEVSLKNAGLREGAFELEIKATDASLAGFGQGNTRTEVLAMRLDTQPPRISVKTLPPSVRRGGAAAIRYTIDEEVTQSGVLVAGYFVPGFLQKDGSYICFFPFPYTMSAVEYKNAVELTATDMAGNVTRSRLGLLAYERNFKSDTISISDNFLASVNSKLGYLAPNAANQLEGYLYINNQVRAANVETLRALRKDTAAAMLWDGMFQRLPRSAARAGFGDHRYFTYQGKQVTVTYQGKVVNASKANQGLNQILITSNWLPNVVPPDVPTPGPGTDETPVPTYDVNLKKISAADGNKVIQGAKFKLHNDSLNQWYVWNTGSNQWTFTTDESKATEFSTNASGVINFTRLGAGTYTVKETQVPTGYFSFVKPSFTLKITDDGHVTITGKDQPGLTGTVNNADGKTTTPTAVVKNIDNITQLPQTGATTMAVMLVGAFAIILVATASGFAAYRVRHENIGDGPIAA